MQNQAFIATENGKAPQSGRLYFLDWFRVFAILVVFLHHCSRIFDYNTLDTELFNTLPHLAPSLQREFNLLWMMPLFFIISGASVYFSLKSRNAGRFVKERILRIAIPLVFIGTFVINPLQIYIKHVFHGHFNGNFFQWYPHYFDGIWPAGGNFMPLGLGTHLWYLMDLFVFSLLLLPLFMPSQKTGTSAISRLSHRFVNPWALALLFVPVSVASAVFEMMGLGILQLMGGWDPLSYLLFFIYGYLVFSDTQIQETIRKYSPAFLVVAVILTALYLDSHFGFLMKIPGVTEHDLLNNGALLPLNPAVWVAVQAFRGLIAWCWILGLLGLGRRFLNFNNSFLTYANEAVLPFYILHHTVIYIIGYYIIQWSSGVGTKYAAIAIMSFAVIMAIYEILIRRVTLLRLLFGMKTPHESEKWQTALSVMTGAGCIVVIALVVVSVNAEKMSPPPTKPGLYVNEAFGMQLTFPTSMNEPGELTANDVLFHIRQPKKRLYLKVRQNAIPINQPLEQVAAATWIPRLMKNMGIKSPDVLSTDVVTTPDGATVLYASVQFETGMQTLAGMYAFVDKHGKRLFIAVYNDDGFEPLKRIMNSLAVK